LDKKTMGIVDQSYSAKFALIKKDLPDFENTSMYERWAKMDLTDDEIWYLSYLEILNENENMVWSGFKLTHESKATLISDRCRQTKIELRRMKK
jgi:hypothetical protein